VEGVPVIRIARWNNKTGENLVADFDAMLNEMRDRPGIIIDVRRNGGGQDKIADQVIGRFLTAPVLSSISFHRIVPGTIYERKILMSDPRGPWRYEGRVAVLTDEGCMSSCEHFVSGMVEAGALICGTPTSGACGLIRTVQLPGGTRLNISQTFPLHSGGIPSPQFGIVPHLWAPRTLDDLRNGQDTALNAALRWVKSNDPLSPRFQTLAPFSRKK
jgi:C-terminal processing protease CtpA/Prc